MEALPPAPRVKQKGVERSELTEAAEPPPAKRGRNASFPLFSLQKQKNTKKAEKTFDFSLNACKLCFGIASPTFRDPVPSSFQLVFQQKYM